MQGKRIKGVIFDLDGTLYSLKGRRLRMTLALWREIRVLRHLPSTRSWLRSRSFDDRDELEKAFCEELGRRAHLTPEQVRVWYRDRFLANFLKMLAVKAQVRPGLIGLLGRLREQGVKLAVISDYGFVHERLQALGIPPEVFDEAQSAEDHGALKPSPKSLNALVQKWGVDPESVVVVGDSQDLDAAGASAAGMGFIGVTDKTCSKPGENLFMSWTEAARTLEIRTGAVNDHGAVEA